MAQARERVAVEIRTVVENLTQAPLFLTGFSGSGKSTIGYSLAFRLRRQFFDLDKEIELLSGLSITRFIEEQGIESFRNFESQILKTLSMTKSSVVALGGGALIDERNIGLVKAGGCLVYLKGNLSDFAENIQKSGLKRPLLGDLSEGVLQRAFKEREPGYLSANIVCDVSDLNILECTDKVLSAFTKWRNENENTLS